MKAILRRVRISDKKANLVAGLVRRKPVTEALTFLKFTPKKGARILYKVIQSAAANAEHNFKQKRADLVIASILVTKGPTYKRSLPVSRGRMHPILTRTCHITVEVRSAAEGESALPSAKKAAEKSVKQSPTASPTPSPEASTTAAKPAKRTRIKKTETSAKSTKKSTPSKSDSSSVVQEPTPAQS